jgi:putative spermidine/putrescine transport system substrate-binding protein
MFIFRDQVKIGARGGDLVETHELDSEMTRRDLLRRAGLAAAVLGVPALRGSEAWAAAATAELNPDALYSAIKSKEFVYANYGGTTEDARDKAFFNSFTQKTGVKIISAPANFPLAEQQMEGKAKPTYDGYHTSGYSIYAYLKYPNHVLPVAAKARKNDLLQKAIQPYGWQTFFIGYVQAYLPGTFKGAQPTSWADFFDVNKFPGKRAWPGAGYYDGTAEVCLLADGVPPDKLYPLDFKRANAKLESIRDHLLFYNQFPQVQQFLTSKSVALAMGPNGLFAGLQNRGVQVQIVLNNAVVTANPSTTPHGAPHADVAPALADWTADPQRQALFSKLTHYGPGTKAALKYLDRETLRQIPNSGAHPFVQTNDKVLAAHYDEYAKANEAFFSKK